MQRDMDLIRDLLMRIEDLDHPRAMVDELVREGEDRDRVVYHMELLHEAGLFNGRLLESGSHGVLDIVVNRLTWQGHEFLDAARNEPVWREAKALMKDKLVSLPFEIVAQLVVQILRGQMGL